MSDPVETVEAIKDRRRNLNRVFGQVLMSLPEVARDQTASTGSYSYSYADINSVLRMLKPVLADHGLALAQPIVPDGDRQQVTTQIINTEDGESLTFSGPSFPVKGDPQAQGSAITYYRRYALVSLFGLAAHDDDGAQASRAAKSPTQRTGAEAEIRALVDTFVGDDRREFVEAFRDEFGCGLSDLPESRHGTALSFTKWWSDPKNNALPSDEQP
jgi:hypothetical protein